MADGPVVPLLPRRVRAGVALAVAVALVAGSLFPGGESVPVSGPLAVGADKWLHAAGYAALAAAVAYTLADAGDGHHDRQLAGAVALVVAVALGVAVELAQTTAPGRVFDFTDILANVAGAALAAAAWVVCARWVRFRRG